MTGGELRADRARARRLARQLVLVGGDAAGRGLRTSADRAILPALQDRFIAEADAALPENPTRTVDLGSSHSPFLSQPDRVAAAILEA
jgi:hypothetical protein